MKEGKRLSKAEYDDLMCKIKHGERLWQDDIQAIINYIGVDDIRFYVPMRPWRPIPFLGLGMKCSSDPEYLTECRICEERYKVFDSYKITLRAIDERFGSDTFYQSDFASSISGNYAYIKIKQDGDFLEPIYVIYEESVPHSGLSIRHEYTGFRVKNIEEEVL